MTIRRFAAAAVLALITHSAFASSARVFVASTGTDAGTCPRTAPCRNFAYAIAQVAPGGELVALDTAGYGPFTITSAVSVYAAPGAVASITATTGNDLTIAASVNDRILIRGLFFNSSGSDHGISFDSGGMLTVQDSTFTNFSTGSALEVVRSSGSPRVFVTNSRFFNSYRGVFANSTGTSINLNIRGCQFEGSSQEAVFAGSFVRGTITDSSFTSSGWGVRAAATGPSAGPSHVAVERSTFIDNAVALQADGGANAIIRAAYCMILSNEVGISTSDIGLVLSRADGTGNQTNTLELNTAGNTFSGPYAAK